MTVPLPAPATTAARRHQAATGVLVALLLGTALFRMSQNMGLTTLSLLARQAVHVGAGTVGIVGSATGLTAALVTLVVSGRVPHTRAAASAAGGMVVLAGSLLALGLAPSVGTLLAGAVVLGGAGAIAAAGILNAVVTEAGPARERIIALYTVVLSIGLAVGPLVETIVLNTDRQDVRAPYLLFAPLPLLGAVLVAPRRRRRREVAGRDRPAPRGAVRAGAGGTGRRDGLLSTEDGRAALVAQLLYAAPFAGISVFGALIARVGFAMSPAGAQLGFTVFFVWSLAARAALAWRAPILRKRAVLLASAGLTVAGLLLLGLGSGTADFLVGMAVLGVPHGLTFPVALALVADVTPVADLPRANATLVGATNLASVLVPLALGGLVPVVGYKATALVLLAPVALFGLVQAGLGGPLRSGRRARGGYRA